MAQRTIHMLFGSLIVNQVTIQSKNRFYVGSILPDAYCSLEQRPLSHFLKHIDKEGLIYIDFQEFLNQYKNKVMEDDLYLGYYMHLVEDAVYRYYLYYEKGLLNKLRSHSISSLHSDYTILNSYIVQKWALPNRLFPLANYAAEQINNIADFDIQKALRDYYHDIHGRVSGKTNFLTETILNEFVEKYAGVLISEATYVKEQGVSGLHAFDYRWEKKP